jgi:hypothetical protein
MRGNKMPLGIKPREIERVNGDFMAGISKLCAIGALRRKICAGK